MTQAVQNAAPQQDQKPLSWRQRTFARELGLAVAAGGRDDELVKAYVAAGYAPDRGNARRLAADPRVKSIADEACAEALRLAGLHIGYLQAKALELLHASPTRIHRELAKTLQADEYGSGEHTVLRFSTKDLTPEEEAALDTITWPLSKLKIDKDGIISIELPDKKGIIEMLAKQLGVGKDEAGDVNVNVGLEALVTQSLQVKEDAA
jgi:hypothetical protein